MNFLKLENVPIFKQLQIEEALLRVDQRNWCIVNHGTSPAIVMGISGKPEKLIDSQKWNEKPIPLIKRFSGGGTVVVDENTLFVTFICNTDFAPISPYPESIMRWSEKIYSPFFGKNFSLEENDYVLIKRKFGGNAQSIIKNRWLHHSSLLWDYCSSKMDYLLMPSKTPSYRQGRQHSDFLCKLADFWPCKEIFWDALIKHLKNQFEMKIVEEYLIEETIQKPHRKATVLLNHKEPYG